MIESINIATNGLLRAERQAADAANGIVKGFAGAASSTRGLTDPTLASQNIDAEDNGGGRIIQDIVSLKTAKLSFEANAKVLKTADQMLGILIDEEV